MQALASFVMRGVPQAVMVIILLAALSLLLPPASIFSAAAVALVTLRSGAIPGVLILGLATGVSGIIALFALGGFNLAIGFLILLWLPAWLLALVLRSSRSLSLVVMGALLLGVVMIGGQFIQTGDPVAEWRSLLTPFVESLVEAQLVETSQQATLVSLMASWMPGIVAAGFFLQLLASLFIGRWWQSMLYNPGGFRAEFHQLRLPKVLAIVLLILVGMMFVQTGSGVSLVEYALVLLVSAWFIHGLALAHGVVGHLGSSSGWLIGIYLLLLFALPHTVIVLAVVGIADAWFDFRARLIQRGSGKAS
ncbi:MAG: DUF2232 domain-containing protein [Sedimenticola sp.]|uniref:DUF2232 domain-containing protein n=1 Tax=Sedimenticola thiotaurini TaxID=1543721 RepID=A0A558D439_9GAMM|nr:DUF2232 domain-containing protein [Sedimenticola sp.]TVT55756.1 MAG: DUF2232 domain-containing protein [Sedimenticola thiotaurini]MCW8882912.1 DUF2232 domain-containing protein [Sedimenticola sp.]MCW8946073.1 DUF2232 domain-containing protein [Sedimenticola sp.]MCW8976961.1 DUF2232 domain-containing protein [Sedimenticola sp.]